MTSYRFLRWQPRSQKSTFGFRFSDGTCLRRWITIFIADFDEISQSTAEIKLLPISENRRPPYWNCTSGFHFDLSVLIAMPYQFFKMAA